jgi:hypothetical protein
MTLQNPSLVLDLIEWIGERSRPYAEVMSAWRTSCPRLTVWEDAVDAGFVVRDSAACRSTVRSTPAGRAFLAANRPASGGIGRS